MIALRISLLKCNELASLAPDAGRHSYPARSPEEDTLQAVNCLLWSPSLLTLDFVQLLSMLGRRHNQELEQDTLNAEEELSQRLDAIMKDKFSARSSAFDAETPIDKTLNLLSGFIGVST